MVTQANKVWCPRCHHRHQLPPDVGEKTLRCRKCRFAFYLSGGLTSDPAFKTHSIASAKESDADLGGHFDDIGDLLSRRDDPLAPRAHVKPKPFQARVQLELDDELVETRDSPAPAEPVTRQRLRSHRNTRKVLMLASFLLACVLGGVSWFIGRDIADQPLADWERKMLYAMGASARCLPPQNVSEEMLLPVNHVKLRGDFIELADRSDSYRDEFPNPQPDLARVVVADVASKPPVRPAQPKSKIPADPPAAAAPVNRPPQPKAADAKRAGVNKAAAQDRGRAQQEPRKLLEANQAAIDQDEFYLHELARSPRLSAPLQSLITLSEKRIAFFTKDKDYFAFGICQLQGERWSIKPIELATKLPVSGFDISDDGERIAIWSRDIIQFWQVDGAGAKAKLVAENASHTAPIRNLVLSNDAKRVFSGDQSGKLFVTVFETGQRIDAVKGFRSPIMCITPKGNSGFVAMDQFGIIRGPRAPVVPFAARVTLACALSEGGTKLAYMSYGKEVVVANVGSKKVASKFQVQPPASRLAFAEDVKYLVAQDHSDIAVWDWRRRERLRVFRFDRKKDGNPVPMAIAQDSQTVVLATGEKRNQISIYEMPGAVKEDAAKPPQDE